MTLTLTSIYPEPTKNKMLTLLTLIYLLCGLALAVNHRVREGVTDSNALLLYSFLWRVLLGPALLALCAFIELLYDMAVVLFNAKDVRHDL